MIESTVGQTYFYIFLKWLVIFAGVYFTYTIVNTILFLIKIRMLNMGPCKALKELERRLKRLEYLQVEKIKGE